MSREGNFCLEVRFSAQPRLISKACRELSVPDGFFFPAKLAINMEMFSRFQEQVQMEQV